MGRSVNVARSVLWIAVATAVSLVAIATFLGEFIPLGWEDWAIAGAIVAGGACALFAFRRASFGRSLTWFGAVAVVSVLVIFDLLDAIIDPFVEADWPIVVIAIFLVTGLGGFLSILISDDE